MPKGPLSRDVVDNLYAVWLSTGSVAECARQCGIHYNTAHRYATKGDPKRGIKPFKAKVASARDRMLRGVPRPDRGPEDHRDDQQEAQVAELFGATLDDWRKETNQALEVVKGLRRRLVAYLDAELPKGVEILEPDGKTTPVGAETAGDLRDLSSAVKSYLDSLKKAAETHDILAALSPQDADGRDDWMQQHFSGWSVQEYEDFKKTGDWPETREMPDWLRHMPSTMSH